MRTRKKYDRKHLLKRVMLDRATYRLEEFQDYFIEIESSLERDKTNLKKRYGNQVEGKELNQRTFDEITEFYAEESSIIEEVFLKNLRYSAVVTIYSALESSMNSLCNYLKSHNKILLELDDLQGAGIERSKRYLKKVCNVEFSKKTYKWTEMQSFNQVRNCIVHAEGIISQDNNPKNITKIINETDGLILIKKRYIGVEKTYIISLINTTKDFLKDLYGKVF